MALVESRRGGSSTVDHAAEKRHAQHRQGMAIGQLARIGRQYAHRYLGEELDIGRKKVREVAAEIGYRALHDAPDAEIRAYWNTHRPRPDEAEQAPADPEARREEEEKRKPVRVERLTKTTKLRHTEADLEAWTRLAGREGITVSALIRRTMRDYAQMRAVEEKGLR
jgi:hypothetical protein